MSVQESATLTNDPSETVIHFADGLIGFSTYRNFQLIENEKLKPFRVLQCTDARHVSFIVIDPRLFVPDYYTRIPANEWRSIGLPTSANRLAFVVVVIRENSKDSTANFAAPLIVNYRKMVGRQVILQDRRFSVCAPLPPEEFAGALL